MAWKTNVDIIAFSKTSYTIAQVAKLFGGKTKYLPARKGERFASALTNMNLSKKVYKIFGKKSLKDYIDSLKNVAN